MYPTKNIKDKQVKETLDSVYNSLIELPYFKELNKIIAKIIQSPLSKNIKLEYIVEIVKHYYKEKVIVEMIIDYFSLFVVCNDNNNKKFNSANVVVHKHLSRLLQNIQTTMEK